MKTQFNLRIDNMSPDELANIDQRFIDAGWVIADISRKIGPHNIRVYQWEQAEIPPVYPDGFEQHKEPLDRIDLDQIARPIDD